jgi:uncharacterized protein Yka (UPF0111/DUF47 family)
LQHAEPAVDRDRRPPRPERGLKNLYLATQKESAMAFFMGNEIYDHLEKVVDRFDDVANQIQGVVIEHV